LRQTLRRRTRLAPETRREAILDATAQVVTFEGVSAVSMERMGREAGVSKALVYNYFPSRNVLLQELLMRETRKYQAHQRKAAEAAQDIDSMIRVTTRAYLDHVAEKGVLIERLMNEPAIAQAMGDIEKEGRIQTVAYLASRLNSDKSMPDEIATMMVELTLGLTGAGGAYLDRSRCDIDLLEDMLVTMIKANVDAVRRQHGGRRQV
jgi:TetR/AcrR family transcriptional regulator, fatty acid biosynthesis regulator